MSELIYDKHIFVCTNQRPAVASRRSCGEATGLHLVDCFRAELKARNLPLKIRTQKAGCLDICDHGPTVVIYPEGNFYVGVEPKDVAEIVEQDVVNGKQVERLLLRKKEG
jgi:(2Fe-2S) ferredoxin